MVTPQLPMHPEKGPDPCTVRWIVPHDAVPFIGPVRKVPAALAELLDSGLLTRITLEPGCVLIRVQDAEVWRERGAQIRQALQQALANPEQWQPESELDRDAQLSAVVIATLEGEVGRYIRSHGGTVTLECAAADAVVLQMGGACAACPALGFTLHSRLETEIRRSYPQLKSIQVNRSRERRLLFRPR